MKKLVLVCIIQLCIHLVNAQSLPVGMPVLEDYYRREQLLGKRDSTVSFTIRPLDATVQKDIREYGADSKRDSSLTSWNGSETFAKGRGFFQVLPVGAQVRYDLHHPYGWNDGSMIAARGLQRLLTAGVYAKYSVLSIQLKPEFNWAQNKEYEGFSVEHEKIWDNYYKVYLNVSDIPERFGESAYRRVNWGQSSIRLNFEPISIGVSTENLWWGPGRRNSLLMSNNAPGFKHITLNTNRPVQTGWGTLEGQIIAGRLENSGFLPPEPYRVFNNQFLYVPKREAWRYLSGMVLTIQPKWTPGLFIGFSEVSQSYGADIKGFNYIPFVQLFGKDIGNQKNSMLSIFTRFLWPESNSEFYLEYGRNDNAKSFRDFLTSPDESRAFVAGFTKLLPFKKRTNEFIQIGIEATQLAQANSSNLRGTGEWYTHEAIRQGYTNEGQVLGAGIGPGSNLQSLEVSWVKGLKKLGLQFERYEHNRDFYNNAFVDVNEIRKHWIDLSAALIGHWNYKNFLFNSNISVIRSLNYQYWFVQRQVSNLYFQPGRDLINFSGQIGVTWRF